VIEHEGNREQRERAAAVLSDLTHDRDPMIAALAEWYEHQPYSRNDYVME
jgi:hypothetical protein